MRAVIQRVKKAMVRVHGKLVSQIGPGLLAFVGICQTDDRPDADYILNKIVHLRIFEDSQGKLNLSVMEVGGGLLLVSQFTLYGDCRKGRRPSFTEAAPALQAEELFHYLVSQARKADLKVETGVFQTVMEVDLINDGPVTLLLDSKRLF